VTNDWKPKLKKIDDVLVEGDLHFRQGRARWARVHVKVGRPKPLPETDYYCPIQARGFFKGVLVICGVAPLDSLMNAMNVLNKYTDYLRGMSDDLGILPKPQLRPYRAWRRHLPRTKTKP